MLVVPSNQHCKYNKISNASRHPCVQGKGDFQVDWHLIGDLKRLKCMYNISKGNNSKTPCL